ncbi:MAG: DapH/DapD/GlmU-related protein [Chthoniobacterales bacterium]
MPFCSRTATISPVHAMEEKKLVKPDQRLAHESPWPLGDRMLRLLWEICWCLFCAWTPKPLNFWRLLWLRLFGARLHGTPFVHQRARIAIPWNLTMHDRSLLGDQANANTLGEIEIGPRASVGQESYLSTGSHDFSRPGNPLVTAKITIEADAFLGARTFVMPGVVIGARSVIGACSVVTRDVPADVFAAGNPCRVLRDRPPLAT